MTEATLVYIIVGLCGQLTQTNKFDDIRTCHESYVRCAVFADGKILTKTDFFKKCKKDLK
jgi:hypothetical protein